MNLHDDITRFRRHNFIKHCFRFLHKKTPFSNPSEKQSFRFLLLLEDFPFATNSIESRQIKQTDDSKNGHEADLREDFGPARSRRHAGSDGAQQEPVEADGAEKSTGFHVVDHPASDDVGLEETGSGRDLLGFRWKGFRFLGESGSVRVRRERESDEDVVRLHFHLQAFGEASKSEFGG